MPRHECFRQRIRGQPVCALHARAGDFADGAKSFKAGAPVKISCDAAAMIVRAWADWNGIDGGIDAAGQKFGVDRRKALQEISN